MLKKYHIDGTVKNKIEQEKTCKHCDDGEMFTGEEQVYKTDIFGNDNREFVCQECLSRYKVPLILPELVVDSYTAVRVTEQDLDKFDMAKEEMSGANDIMFALKISEDYSQGVINMDMEGIEINGAREEYDKHGTCDKHIWIESQPFKTSEGSFTIKSCAVCRLGQMEYQGQIIQDTLTELIKYVSHRGIIHDSEIIGKKQEFEKVVNIPEGRDLNMNLNSMIEDSVEPVEPTEPEGMPDFDIETQDCQIDLGDIDPNTKLDWGI